MYSLIIVEDDYQIRIGLSQFFPWNEVGFEMAGSFENGREALDFLEANPHIDVALTDIRMPVMDGLGLAGHMREQYPSILIVFLSAYRDFEYARAAINMGVENYIVKTTKYDELINVFRRIRSKLDRAKYYEKETGRTQNAESSLSIPDNQIIRNIRDYIYANYATATLRTVADHVHMNAIYMSRYFKENTGMNFSMFLMDIRMQKAAELIKSRRYKIVQISDMVGYSNEKNFSRAFKKYFNASPINFRRL